MCNFAFVGGLLYDFLGGYILFSVFIGFLGAYIAFRLSYGFHGGFTGLSGRYMDFLGALW
jgi:hypothetical protein